MEGDCQRLPHWSEKERLLVIKLINDRFDCLFNKFKGANMGYKQKDAVWQQVADEFNSSGIAQCRRTVENIKTMYKNTKARAKTKESERKKTGGGPQVSLTSAEDEVMKVLKDKPQMKGINGGIESSVPSSVASEIAATTTSVESVEDLEATVFVDQEKETSESCGISTSEGSKRGTKRKRGGITSDDELYQLEKERAKLEIELLRLRIKQEKDLFSLKVAMLNESREQDKSLFSLKQELLSSSIKNALDGGLISFEQ